MTSVRAAASSPTPRAALPPVVVVGGGANALSVARSLGRIGVTVYAVTRPQEHVRYSRFCRWIDIPPGKESWTRFLLGPGSEKLRGAVVLACNDLALEIIATHRAELEKKFLLEESNPVAQLRMLDKLATYELAVAASVATPRFWEVRSEADVHALKDELPYPLLVKPLLSYVYQQQFTRKMAIAGNWEELLSDWRNARDVGIDVMLVEMIPGPDDLLCSYYTYLDEHGQALFDFTKRVIRRYPPVSGIGCYHITDRIPELKEPALRLLRGAGVRGLANVEFKLDSRDGQLKLIECNARFTAANCLVAASGFDLAQFVYNRLTGRPQVPLVKFRTGLRLWYAYEDYLAFRQLRRQSRMSWTQWLAGILHRQTFPYFAWDDPWPSIHEEGRRFWGALRHRSGRALSLLLGSPRREP